MTNFEVIIKEHPQFVKECLAHCRVQDVLKAVVEGKQEHDSWYNRGDDRDEMNFLNAEYVHPVLDNIEKKYLSDVIRPFKHNVKYIVKLKSSYSEQYYIEIKMFQECDLVTLPYFSTNSEMYKGMKERVNYTLNDLGL